MIVVIAIVRVSILITAIPATLIIFVTIRVVIGIVRAISSTATIPIVVIGITAP
jgi:hypothetical protein